MTKYAAGTDVSSDRSRAEIERTLVIKARFEAVESGISTVDREFATQIVLPDGRTVGEYLLPAIEEAYQSGSVPPLMPSYGPPALAAGRSHDG